MRTFTTLLALFAVVDAATAQWNLRGANGPPASYHAVMAHDLARAHTVLMITSPSPQMWTYDGTSWQQRSPAHMPTARGNRQMVYDLARGRMILYGGLGGSSTIGTAADETWEWDGTDWTQVQTVGSPGGLESYTAAFDLVRNRLVVYGGLPNSWFPQASDRTWEFDGSNWTRVITPTQPPPLERASACHDVARRQVVMFGGRDPATNTLTDDTWTYDGTDWTRVNVTGPRPQPRINGNLVYDLVTANCVLFGGRDPVTMNIFNDYWTFDGTSWSQRTDLTSGIYPPRDQGAMAFDNTRRRIVYFGGRTANTAIMDETYEYGASFRTFGTGCAGSNGVPRLQSTGEPRLGTTYQVTLANLPANPVALMATSISNSTWAFGSLPMLLTPFGMPGCRSYVSADLLQIVSQSSGTATWSWPVPFNTALVGTPFYQQGLAIDPSVNAAGLTVSNAGASVIGH